MRQAVSPSSENWPAVQLAHTMFAVVLQVELPSHTLPAGHAVVLKHAAQGARPDADHVLPATHGSEHAPFAPFAGFHE